MRYPKVKFPKRFKFNNVNTTPNPYRNSIWGFVESKAKNTGKYVYIEGGDVSRIMNITGLYLNYNFHHLKNDSMYTVLEWVYPELPKPTNGFYKFQQKIKEALA